MDELLKSRAVRALGVVATVFAAACFAVFAMNLLTPARELSQLLPTAAPTRRPPPTITPVAYPPTPALVRADDFSTTENFPRASGVKVPFGYLEPSGYQLTPPLDPGYVRVLDRSFTDPDYRNLTLEVEGAPAPDSPPVAYGMLFWHTEDASGQERFLAFAVSTRGTFQLSAFQPVTATRTAGPASAWSDVVPPATSTAIHLDGTPNRLRVDVHPRRLLAYINDELVIDTDVRLVTEWRLSRDFDGRVGLVALSAGEVGAGARFTRFDVYADVKP